VTVWRIWPNTAKRWSDKRFKVPRSRFKGSKFKGFKVIKVQRFRVQKVQGSSLLLFYWYFILHLFRNHESAAQKPSNLGTLNLSTSEPPNP
jgi:hypothetical protein